ncbi:uncharacterized protein EDB91DRAFT_569220 [Suillus paluster]|uniref:uncharacterized protein n=1 Tax=Suillus paluster TaxID=48578 RepID=UPI001B87BD71|nr:uncharacterized protein EDB91DRAFT_569220 [Suillus paluster]KAG1735111.1 hypothetical protein EDB91DRAFT_569220 [Suillus paluster]
MTTNSRIIFNEMPHGLPNPKTALIVDDTQSIDLDNVPLQGGILVKALAFSLDPYMRNRMRPVEIQGDIDAFALGETITGFSVAVVLRSETPLIQAGQHVYGFMHANALGMKGLSLQVLDNKYNLPWRYYVGILGMTGQTAYYGLKDISNPKPGETLYISAACGAVGHMVVQLAKAQGLKVIASCGSDQKVSLVKSLGADHVFNYKTANTAAELRMHGPIDIYFDNVGGPTLEAAIDNVACNARIVICGMVSQYNLGTDKTYGIRNLWLLNRYRAKMEGLVVIDWADKYLDEFHDVVPRDLAAGKLKYLEHVYNGMERVGEALVDLLIGNNVGKSVLVLEDGV